MTSTRNSSLSLCSLSKLRFYSSTNEVSYGLRLFYFFFLVSRLYLKSPFTSNVISPFLLFVIFIDFIYLYLWFLFFHAFLLKRFLLHSVHWESLYVNFDSFVGQFLDPPLSYGSFVAIVYSFYSQLRSLNYHRSSMFYNTYWTPWSRK